jgi:hypothetical protein
MNGLDTALQVGFYLNTCICMEKGRTYFEQDVEFMHQMGFDTVCNAPARLPAPELTRRQAYDGGYSFLRALWLSGRAAGGTIWKRILSAEPFVMPLCRRTQVKIDQCGSAMNMSLWAALINATGRPMMMENCHNAPSWWSPGADAATTCDSNMWRSGGDIGNGFGTCKSECLPCSRSF